MASATDSTAGSPPAAACACSNASSTQKAAANFLDFRPTLFFGVPTIYVRLLDIPAATAREIGAAMRLFVSGSAPLPAQVLEDFRALYGHTILERYGMSENLMNISQSLRRRAPPRQRRTPAPGRLRASLVDGEIQLKGPNLFAGYWRREDATRAAFTADGWFRTGDLATCAPDGYYTLSGRKSDLIISGGFNIYPREIEEFLQEQPEIAEAAVVGATPTPSVAKSPSPTSSAAPPSTRTTSTRAAALTLASFKIPRAFHPVDALPRNAMGKIQKHLLK